jgi:hypothetical protein
MVHSRTKIVLYLFERYAIDHMLFSSDNWRMGFAGLFRL